MYKNIFLCGSLAYDNIILSTDDFHDKFHKYGTINMSLTVNKIKVEYGGCAGNIAYGLSKLNIKPYIISSLGSQDEKKYIKSLEDKNINTKYIKVFDGLSAHAHIINDKKNNQITSFYLGSLQNSITDIPFNQKKSLVIISPDNVDNMKFYAKYCIKNNIDYIFDPGQVISLFSKQDLKKIISKSKILILNNFELEVLKTILKKKNNIYQIAKILIVTSGADGSKLYKKGQIKYNQSIYKVSKTKVLDPTGCGDAYRAGIIYGIIQDDIKKGMELGSYLASCNIMHYGTQNYSTKQISKLL